MRASVLAAQAHLADLLLPGYRRQPHVTLALCGFPTQAPRHPDDFGPADLDAQLAALQALDHEPFELEIGPLASFSSAPFLAVHDPQGGIARLRHALVAASRQAGQAGGPYTPHVTVGLYAGSWPTADIQRRLDDFPSVPALRCRIEGISLMHYAAPEIGGPLSTLADFHLAARRLSWRQGPPPDL